jgi:hypothetical protein
MNSYPRRQRPPWYTRAAPRILFQHRLTGCGLRTWAVPPPRRYRSGYALQVLLHVEDLPEQMITIVFSRTSPDMPRVYTSGSDPSPHRYRDGSLCMWFPGDPPEQRWSRSHGPVALMGHVVAHLIREEWWRKTGEWPGPEAPHDQNEVLRSAAEASTV